MAAIRREIKEVEAHSKLTQEELDKTTSRLVVCEKKLEATRQELAMLKGTPDGEAFAAAEQYKLEIAKTKEVADVGCQVGVSEAEARHVGLRPSAWYPTAAHWQGH